MGKPLDGMLAFVGVGVGAGIDAELARRLAAEGATVVVVAADAAQAAAAGEWVTQQVAEPSIQGVGGGRTAVHCAGGDAEADVDALVELATELSR